MIEAVNARGGECRVLLPKVEVGAPAEVKAGDFGRRQDIGVITQGRDATAPHLPPSCVQIFPSMNITATPQNICQRKIAATKCHILSTVLTPATSPNISH